MIFKNPLGFNVYGASLFRGYYTIHDSVTNTIGFAPTPGSPKGRLESGEIPDAFFVAPLTFQISLWVYILTAIFVIGVATLYYFALLPWLRTEIKS